MCHLVFSLPNKAMNEFQSKKWKHIRISFFITIDKLRLSVSVSGTNAVTIFWRVLDIMSI